MTYASAQGRTLLDRELYLPRVWADDLERRREAGVPEKVEFRTKPQLARRMLERSLESGVPFGWVTGTRSTATTAASAVAGAARHSPCAGRQEQRQAVGRDGQGMATGAGGPAGAWGGGIYPAGCGSPRATGPRVLGRLRLGLGEYGPSGAGQRVLAAGPAQRGQARGVGLLPASARRYDSGGTGAGAGTRWAIEESLRRPRARWVWTSMKPEMGWLVPAHHPGDAFPRLPGGGQAPVVGTRRSGSPATILGRKADTPDGAGGPAVALADMETSTWTNQCCGGPGDGWHQATARRCHYRRRLKLLTTFLQL